MHSPGQATNLYTLGFTSGRIVAGGRSLRSDPTFCSIAYRLVQDRIFTTDTELLYQSTASFSSALHYGKCHDQ
jgi:hypothetical protein